MSPLIPAWGILTALTAVGLVYADTPASGLALAHGVLAGLTWLAWRLFGQTALTSRRAGWISLALPGIGPLAALLITGRADARSPESAETAGRDWPGPLELALLAPPRRGVTRLEPKLLNGDLEAGLSAVRALKALEGAEGVRMLRQALHVKGHQAPLLASLALAELETEFENAIREARHVVDQNDPAARSAGVLALAGILRSYLESGLPTGAAATDLWLEVRDLAIEALSGNADVPPPVLAWRHLAVARLALCEPAGALEAADEALARSPADPASVMLKLEALYALRDLDRLRAEAAKLITFAVPGTVAHDIATYWSTSYVPQIQPRTR